jgi:hypothetical protein
MFPEINHMENTQELAPIATLLARHSLTKCVTDRRRKRACAWLLLH